MRNKEHHKTLDIQILIVRVDEAMRINSNAAIDSMFFIPFNIFLDMSDLNTYLPIRRLSWKSGYARCDQRVFRLINFSKKLELLF